MEIMRAVKIHKEISDWQNVNFRRKLLKRRKHMDIIVKLSEELSVQKWQVEAAVGLIDEGNTIPFISRYRKEVTGSLNDEQLRNLHERLVYLRNLEDKKAQVLSSIEEQGKLRSEERRVGKEC